MAQRHGVTVTLRPPAGGIDKARLEAALDMLITEDDIIDYFSPVRSKATKVTEGSERRPGDAANTMKCGTPSNPQSP